MMQVRKLCLPEQPPEWKNIKLAIEAYDCNTFKNGRARPLQDTRHGLLDPRRDDNPRPSSLPHEFSLWEKYAPLQRLPGPILMELRMAMTSSLTLTVAAISSSAHTLNNNMARTHASISVAGMPRLGRELVVLEQAVDGLLVVPQAHGEAGKREGVGLAGIRQLHAQVARRPPRHHPAPQVHAARVRHVKKVPALDELAQLGQHERLRQTHQERRRLAYVAPVVVVEDDPRVVA